MLSAFILKGSFGEELLPVDLKEIVPKRVDINCTRTIHYSRSLYHTCIARQHWRSQVSQYHGELRLATAKPPKIHVFLAAGLGGLELSFA